MRFSAIYYLLKIKISFLIKIFRLFPSVPSEKTSSPPLITVTGLFFINVLILMRFWAVYYLLKITISFLN